MPNRSRPSSSAARRRSAPTRPRSSSLFVGRFGTPPWQTASLGRGRALALDAMRVRRGAQATGQRGLAMAPARRGRGCVAWLRAATPCLEPSAVRGRAARKGQAVCARREEWKRRGNGAWTRTLKVGMRAGSCSRCAAELLSRARELVRRGTDRVLPGRASLRVSHQFRFGLSHSGHAMGHPSALSRHSWPFRCGESVVAWLGCGCAIAERSGCSPSTAPECCTRTSALAEIEPEGRRLRCRLHAGFSWEIRLISSNQNAALILNFTRPMESGDE
jgi:hypothetical protein